MNILEVESMPSLVVADEGYDAVNVAGRMRYPATAHGRLYLLSQPVSDEEVNNYIVSAEGAERPVNVKVAIKAAA